MFPKSPVVRLVYLARYSLPTLLLAALVPRRKPVGPAPAPPRILVALLESIIGDFILDTPFLRELRRCYPDSHITLVVGRKVQQLAAACPYVDEAIGVGYSPKIAEFPNPLRYFFATARYLKDLVASTKQRFGGCIDIAILPRWDWEAEGGPLLAFFSGAPRTVAYSEKTSDWKRWCNFGQDTLFTDVLAPGTEPHEAKRGLNIVRYLGGSVESTAPEIWWLPEDRLEAERFLSAHQLPGADPVIAFGVGASGARRHWPYFTDLIRLLAGAVKFTPILLAGPGEEHLVAPILAATPSAAVLQGAPLRVVAAILSRCSLFVGNDSGPMHLAAAAGLPVVEISCHAVGGDAGHRNSPVRYGPLAAHTTIVRPKAFLGDCQGGCTKDTAHCITTVSAQEVASAALDLLRFADRV